MIPRITTGLLLLSISLCSCSPTGQSIRDISEHTHRTQASSPPQAATTIDGFRKQLGEREGKQTRIHVLPVEKGSTAVILELEGESRPVIWVHNTSSHAAPSSSIKREQQVRDYLSSIFIYKDKHRIRYRLTGALYVLTGHPSHMQEGVQSLSQKMLAFSTGTIWSVKQERIHSKTRSGLAGARYWQARHEEYALRTSSSFKLNTWSASPLRSLTDPLAAYDLLLTKQDSTACLLLVPAPFTLGDEREECANQMKLSEDTFRLTLRNSPTIEFPLSSSIRVIEFGLLGNTKPSLHRLPLH